MSRRFAPGDTFRIAGIAFRVRKGKKLTADGRDDVDLVLDWRTETGWQPIPAAAAGLIADFLFENEEHLYPPRSGWKGGRKFRDYLWHAMKHGWEKADAGLRVERRMQTRLFEENAT